ncbi:MAG: hypothetical protein HQK91_14370 [Nitrospirae bacterium]|nr:hypothetical protein [Nitrospirota bacterium]MBF0542623.1 hypothetical protein [Nitrospirota bacterium]
MKKTCIYVDTSVIGGCCDPEFMQWSNALLTDFKLGFFNLLLSELTDAEIYDAPEEVKKIYSDFRQLSLDIIKITEEVIELTEAYLSHNILSKNYRSDAIHIAAATIAGADLIVSWNFKHIVHFDKIQKFNAVNIEVGYKPVLIYSPLEVTRHDD